jgi:hypothetical protein
MFTASFSPNRLLTLHADMPSRTHSITTPNIISASRDRRWGSELSRDTRRTSDAAWRIDGDARPSRHQTASSPRSRPFKPTSCLTLLCKSLRSRLLPGLISLLKASAQQVFFFVFVRPVGSAGRWYRGHGPELSRCGSRDRTTTRSCFSLPSPTLAPFHIDSASPSPVIRHSPYQRPDLFLRPIYPCVSYYFLFWWTQCLYTLLFCRYIPSCCSLNMYTLSYTLLTLVIIFASFIQIHCVCCSESFL